MTDKNTDFLENGQCGRTQGQNAAKPARRVGSVTMGLALIVTGVCFLLYYFVPGFDYLLAAKLSPLLLIALGGEVLVCAAKPGRGKYDFLSIFVCLCVMGGCFALSLLPAAWSYLGPDRHQNEERLAAQLEDALYEKLRGGAVEKLTVNLSLPYGATASEDAKLLDMAEYLSAYVYLTGEYADEAAFAAECRTVLDAFQSEKANFYGISIRWTKALDPNLYEDDEMRYSLEVSSRYMLDWSAEQLAAATECYKPSLLPVPETPDGEAAADSWNEDKEMMVEQSPGEGGEILEPESYRSTEL